MFEENKYTAWYFNIVNAAKERDIPSCYCEKHHIIPKCFGGPNTPDNLVILTAREHYICHLLLMKMVIDKRRQFQMVAAFTYMTHMKKKGTLERYTSRSFAFHKSLCSRIKSIAMSGDGNPRFGVVMSQETKDKISVSKKGRRPNYTSTGLANMAAWTAKRNTDPEFAKKVSEGLKRSYLITFPDGSKEIITGMKDYCISMGLAEKCMLRLGNGKMKYYRGFTVIPLGKLNSDALITLREKLKV